MGHVYVLAVVVALAAPTALVFAEEVRCDVDAFAAPRRTKALDASLGQPAWNQAIQPQLASVRGRSPAFSRMSPKLQAANRSAGMNVGVQLFDRLQARAQDFARALDGLVQARDATAARGALSQISVALGQLTKAYDPPPCCLLTCCAIRIQ